MSMLGCSLLMGRVLSPISQISRGVLTYKWMPVLHCIKSHTAKTVQILRMHEWIPSFVSGFKNSRSTAVAGKATRDGHPSPFPRVFSFGVQFQPENQFVSKLCTMRSAVSLNDWSVLSLLSTLCLIWSHDLNFEPGKKELQPVIPFPHCLIPFDCFFRLVGLVFQVDSFKVAFLRINFSSRPFILQIIEGGQVGNQFELNWLSRWKSWSDRLPGPPPKKKEEKRTVLKQYKTIVPK